MVNHSFILVDNSVKSDSFIIELKNGQFSQFQEIGIKNLSVFSTSQINKFIEEETLHDIKVLTKDMEQPLRSMSSGERKKALLKHLVANDPKTMIAVNPFDNLDMGSQKKLRKELAELGKSIQIILISTRMDDTLPQMDNFFQYNGKKLIAFSNEQELRASTKKSSKIPNNIIPSPFTKTNIALKRLVEFKNVSVAFNGKPVLNNINWAIGKGEFWQLMGPNGSGKSTLLQMITGDSHKGYGQDLTIFGHKKGSGESVWDLKELIGYFSPHMVDRFRGYQTLENMMLSGIYDSVGLYVRPSETAKNKALEWLGIIGLQERKDNYFRQLSQGDKRLVMTARAMIKHPPLLILDEPTIGLDDDKINFFVSLINTYARQSDSAIVYVSHRIETGLDPNHLIQLCPTAQGSIAKIG